MTSAFIQQLHSSNTREQRQQAINEALQLHGKTCLKGLSLAGCDLSGLNLSELKLEHIDFRGSNCIQTSFTSMWHCILDEVDAEGSHITRAFHCSFRGSKLYGAWIYNGIVECDYTRAIFDESFMSPMVPNQYDEYENIQFCQASMKHLKTAGTYYVGANLEDATLHSARLPRTNFTNAILRSADFRGANLIHAVFDGADTEGSVFDQCLVNEELADMLTKTQSINADGLTIASFISQEKYQKIDEIVSTMGQYRINAIVEAPQPFRSEKLLITRKPSENPMGHTFDLEKGVYLGFYFFSESLSGVLFDMAADYARWKVDYDSITIKADKEYPAELKDLIHAALSVRIE